MTLIVKILIGSGVAVLATFSILRFTAPNLVAGPQGFLVLTAGTFLATSGIAWSKNVDLGPPSPWGALVAITSLMVGGVVYGVLGADEVLNGLARPEALSIAILIIAFVSYGWWKLLTGSPNSIAQQSGSGSAISLIGAALIAIAFLVRWLLER